MQRQRIALARSGVESGPRDIWIVFETSSYLGTVRLLHLSSEGRFSRPASRAAIKTFGYTVSPIRDPVAAVNLVSPSSESRLRYSSSTRALCLSGSHDLQDSTCRLIALPEITSARRRSAIQLELCALLLYQGVVNGQIHADGKAITAHT